LFGRGGSRIGGAGGHDAGLSPVVFLEKAGEPVAVCCSRMRSGGLILATGI
jgi:hypothetical protein